MSRRFGRRRGFTLVELLVVIAIIGTLVALLAGVAGYFVVLRGQSFVAHMLSQVGFPGAAAGVLVHVSPVLGLIAFCITAALGIGWMGRNLDAGHRAESAAVGSILAFSLGLGLLFFRLYAGSAGPNRRSHSFPPLRMRHPRRGPWSIC